MPKNIDSSIEFYIPERGLDLETYLSVDPDDLQSPKQIRLHKQAVHHLSRYYWAIKVLRESKGINVLDVACGAGYGTYLLSEALPDINFYGADYDHRAVNHAKKTYGESRNRRYIQFDLETWTSSSNKETPIFETVISFDTIEHLNHRDIFLINLAESLPISGQLLISTPIRKENLLQPGWEHHKIEYGVNHFRNLLGRFFNKVTCPKSPNFPELSFWNNKVNAHRALYLNKFNPVVCADPIKKAI